MADELKHLTHAVQYRGIDYDISPSGWRTMAAFDQEHVAERYAEKCRGDTWEYRVIPIPQEQAMTAAQQGVLSDG